jgi:hypothetical protein
MCDRTWLEISFRMACHNWERWRNDYEAAGEFRNLPVLTYPERFRSFWKEYSVLQGVRLPRDRVRAWLTEKRDSTVDVCEGAAQSVDRLKDELAMFLHGEGERNCNHLSFVSKLAAFARPEVFVAKDSNATHGLLAYNEAAGDTYEAYMAAVNAVFDGELGGAIRQYADDLNHPGTDAAFSRRMMDVYLMLEGGRWRDLRPWPL